MNTPPIFDLRPAVADDANAIWAVRVRAIDRECRAHYPADLIDAWLASPMPASFSALIEAEKFIVAVSRARIVGFAGLKPSVAEIEALFVDPEFTGLGVGRRLLMRLEQLARELGLSTVALKASLNSVTFYRSAGYVERGRGEHTSFSGLRLACVHMDKGLRGSI